METKKDWNIVCHICGSEKLKFFKKYENFSRITSDCRPWTKKGFLAICEDCKTVQNKIDSAWHEEIKEIYNTYEIYHQSEGVEQKVFGEKGESFTRSEKLIQSLQKHITIKKEGKLLDIGCGNGGLLRTFSSLYPEWKLTGQEFGNKYKETVEKIKNVKAFYAVPVNEISEKFDIAVMLHVLEHIDHPKKILIELKNKLNEDGLLIIEVPNHLENPFDLLIADHATHFSSNTLINLLKISGYEIIFSSENIIAKELTVVAKKSSDAVDNKSFEQLDLDKTENIEKELIWLENLVKKGKELSQQGRLGLFGTSIAATWLFNELRDRVKFFVDEDPSRTGKKYMNCKIYSPTEISKENIIFMPMVPLIGNTIKKRLSGLNLNLVIEEIEDQQEKKMEQKEKVIVIGSNSFSGSHFVDLLLEKGKYHVIGISRSEEKNEIYLPYKKRDLSNFEFHQLDLNKNMPEIIALADKHKTEYIVNFASQSIVGASWKHPLHWYRTNILSTVELTNTLKDRKYLKKYVHVSTPEVYGSCSGDVKEDALFNPSTPYAASRAAADNFLQLLIKQFNFPAVFTRAANVYGPGQQLFKIIPRSIIYIKKGKKIPLHGGGEAQRSFIHIRDVCEATLDIMEKAKPGEIYHLSTDKLLSIKDLVNLICEKMNTKFEESVENVETRRGLDDAYILNSEKAKQEFEWDAKIKLEKGIDETVEWINKNWDMISSEELEYIHKE